ncbi:MAG TPA: amidohydrolase family protein, partial [Acetobacteraceae bacterium]|nr:amidohydrolase family protein [Acetobacteraceae bacterium]
ERVDCTRRLLHPGLVNAHTHGHGNLAKSSGDRWTLELLLAAGPWVGGLAGAEEKLLAATIGAAEMVLKGCTAAYDLFVEFPGPSRDGIDAVAEGYQAVGMRAVIAPMVADLTLYEAIPGLAQAAPAGSEPPKLPEWTQTIATMRAIMHEWRFDTNWLRPAVAPTIPLHCRDAFLEACRDLAHEFEAGLHSHVAESKVQAVVGKERYGRSLTAHMDALGLLGPRFTAAHGVWLDAEDMALLGHHGASVAHNPASNMRLGNGVADMAGMLAAGVNVGLGTDAATCSDNLNMYSSMHFAAAASHARGPDPARWVTAPQVLEAATTGSAAALGFEHVGRIAPGFAADIVFLDLDAPTLIPLNDPVNQLVFGEDGTSVHSVMIGGRFVVRERKLLTVDLPALAARAEAARAEMAARNAGRRASFECVAPVIADFCPALAARPWHINRWCGC